MATNKSHVKFAICCRACLQVKKDMRPLFEQLTATMLMGITNVQVEISDGLPAQLCLQCVHQISRCYSFKEMVERNDVILKEIYQENLEAQAMGADNIVKESEKEDNVLGLSEVTYTFMENAQPENYYLEQRQVQPEQEEPQKKLEESEDGEDKQESGEPDEETYLQMVTFHASSSVTPGRHICNLCYKEFKHPRWLKLHMRSHSNWIRANCKKPPMCKVCNRTFKGPGMLKMHMKTHEERPQKQPTCTVCKRIFPTKTLLYRHRQTHFEQKQYPCNICEKSFFSAYALRSHLARHRGERPYVCPLCNKSFYNPTDLKVHYRLHTGEKPLKCSECNKTFRRHSTLCQHMKKHRGVRNHVCSVCNKAFFELSKLTSHMRVHTGEKPFECNECDRKFAQQSALMYHKRTHTGEKPYTCKICSAKFVTHSARTNHIMMHGNTHKRNNIKLSCPVCYKVFNTKAEFKEHSKKQYCKDPDDDSADQKANIRTKKTGVKSDSDQEMKEDEGSEDIVESQQATEENQLQEEQPAPVVVQKRFKCSYCEKAYSHLHSLKKHIHAMHVQVHQIQTSTPQQIAMTQQPQTQPQVQHIHIQQAHHQQAVQQHQTLVQVGGVQQLVPIQQQTIASSPIHVQNAQQGYPVISSVQSLQLQQSQQQANQPQQLQVQTIQLHPQHQPIQIHTVGVHQQQLQVASSCQSVIPNIVQLQAVSTLAGQQDLTGNIPHRIILQQQPGMHPSTLFLHH